jgi:hypothetical protein
MSGNLTCMVDRKRALRKAALLCVQCRHSDLEDQKAGKIILGPLLLLLVSGCPRYQIGFNLRH